MHECPCVSDLMQEVSDAKGPRHQLPLFVLSGEVLEAAGGSQRIVGSDLKLDNFSRELFGLLEGGIEDDDTSSDRRAPVQSLSSSCSVQWWPGFSSADNTV